ncbi:MAG: tyrosine-type recombinase/integrase [Lachnospiraceae bacterium]|nr:tyrosine-type recombinase/integrase [Lachnospiraceae bacterium]
MPDTLVSILMKEKDRQERARVYYQEYYNHYYVNERFIISQDGNDEEVFFVTVRDTGDYISPRTMQWVSQVIHKELDIPDYDFHSLRHTHASMLAQNDALPVYVSRRLGHKNLTTTLNVYYHSTEMTEVDGDHFLNQIF